MESFSFLHSPTSVDNSAKFAAAANSAADETGMSSADANINMFDSTSKSTFNTYLMNTIDGDNANFGRNTVEEKANSASLVDDKKTDTALLAKNLISALNNESARYDNKTPTADNKTDLDLKDSNEVKIEQDNDFEIDILVKLKRAIETIEPPSLKNDIANEFELVKADLEKQIATQRQLVSEQNIISTSIDDEIDNINAQLQSADVENKILAEQQITSTEIENINAQLQDEDLSPHETELIDDELNRLETLKSIVNDYQTNSQQVRQQLQASELDIHTSATNHTINAIEKQDVVDDFVINAVKDTRIEEKLVALLDKLPTPVKESLNISEPVQPLATAPKIGTTAQQFLTSIQESHKALAQQSAQLSSDTPPLLPPEDAKYKLEQANQAVANMVFKSDDKGNVNTEKLMMFEASEIIETEHGEVGTNLQRENQLIAQLESSFRSASQSTSISESSVTTRIEQQAIKEANAPLTAQVKQTELQHPRIILNENGVAAQQLKEHLTMMSRGGLGHAVLQLDPEELGAMSVRISMQNDQMSVQFQVQNSQAKDMLEQAMYKLKESLQEQGIALNNSDVNQQNGENNQSNDTQLVNHNNNNDDLDDSDLEPITLVLNKQSANGIDYYA